MNRERCNEKAQASQCRFQAETEAECRGFLERAKEIDDDMREFVVPIFKNASNEDYDPNEPF